MAKSDNTTLMLLAGGAIAAYFYRSEIEAWLQTNFPSLATMLPSTPAATGASCPAGYYPDPTGTYCLQTETQATPAPAMGAGVPAPAPTAQQSAAAAATGVPASVIAAQDAFYAAHGLPQYTSAVTVPASVTAATASGALAGIVALGAARRMGITRRPRG